MIWLALEFSSPLRGVALVRRPAPPDSVGLELGHAAETRDRGSDAFALIEQVLSGAGLEREAVEGMVVGLGPGSHAGIRSAIAMAQGWQLARGIQLLGMSSVEVLAWEAFRQGLKGRVHVASDAQRGEFHLATYGLDATMPHPAEPLRLASLAEVEALIQQGECVVGPDLTARLPRAVDLYPRAATLGRLAATRSDFIAGEKPEPIYLRETNFMKAPPPRFGSGRPL